jgi:hypothetical protein
VPAAPAGEVRAAGLLRAAAVPAVDSPGARAAARVAVPRPEGADKLRSHAIENFNGQFKAIFDTRGSVPTRGLLATRRYVLGAVFVYQLTLLYRFLQGADLRVGLKPFLKAA